MANRTTNFPLIGVTTPPSWNSKLSRYEYSPRPSNYADAVNQLGGIAIMLPPDPDLIESQVRMLDGLVLTGGGDVDPAIYGAEVPHRAVYGVNARRDEYEFALFAGALKWNLPVLGVCRGLQIINVAFGGTLWQDVDEERPRGRVMLKHTGGGYYTQGGTYSGLHRVRVRSTSLMADIYRADVLEANSYHHQAVRSLGRDLYICGRTADGVVESIAHNERQILGLQFHPEMMQSYRTEHRRPFRWLISEASLVMRKSGGRRAALAPEDRERMRSLRSVARWEANEARRVAAQKGAKGAPVVTSGTKATNTTTSTSTGAAARSGATEITGGTGTNITMVPPNTGVKHLLHTAVGTPINRPLITSGENVIDVAGD